MIVTTLLISILFFNYYFLCQNHIKYENKVFYLILFIFLSIVLRLLIPTDINKDYIGYYELYNYNNPENILSFLISEPYLLIISNGSTVFPFVLDIFSPFASKTKPFETTFL